MFSITRGPASSRTLAALAAVGLCAALLAGCSDSRPADSATSTPETDQDKSSSTVTLVTYDSFPLSDETAAAFTKKTGYKLKVVKNGDGVELTNKLILTKDAPLGDAVFGFDNNTAQAAVDAGALADFTGKLAPSVQKVRGDSKQLVPVDRGEVCVNYDVAYFQKKGQQPPATFDDLAKPEYKNLTVVEDPRTSTPGLAFLLSTINAKGENGWMDYWKSLKENGVKSVGSWDDAFNVDFTAGSNDNGSAAYPIMVSYASSPAWAVSDDGSVSTIGNVPATCYQQIEYAGVLKGAKNPAGAAALVQFLTEETAQKDLTENNYMYPVLDSVQLPEPLAKFGAPSGQAAMLKVSDVVKNREAWVRSWASIMG